jgi:hypothetical protein
VQKIQAAIGQLLDTMSVADLVGEDVPAILSVNG